MKKRTALLGILLVASCAARAEPRSWAFVQTVGGISVGSPVNGSSGWRLPVLANVSGLQTITTRPTVLNSGLSCQSVDAVVEGRFIFITVITSAASSGSSAQCPPAALGALKPGNYVVQYRGPKEQSVTLKEVAVGV